MYIISEKMIRKFAESSLLQEFVCTLLPRNVLYIGVNMQIISTYMKTMSLIYNTLIYFFSSTNIKNTIEKTET